MQLAVDGIAAYLLIRSLPMPRLRADSMRNKQCSGRARTTSTPIIQNNHGLQRKPFIQPSGDEGRVLTSAGSAAGLDMLIHLVRQDFGAKIANQVAQRLVMAPRRQGDQAQFVPRPVASDERGRLAALLDWTRAHLALEHTIDSLASRAAMSSRTLQREFKNITGLAPYAWIVRERIERASISAADDERDLVARIVVSARPTNSM
jgi:AraC-like DNA-binding protein